jgi:hypothetical protein
MRKWYLNQNPDVANSGIKPFYHFLKYGRNESRTWNMPLWFRSAFKNKGWVWKNSATALHDLGFDVDNLKKRQIRFQVYRIGDYHAKIARLRKENREGHRN